MPVYNTDFFGNPVRNSDWNKTPNGGEIVGKFFMVVFTVVASLLLGLLLSIPFALLGGWALMLAIGIVHLHVLASVQAVGYWLCVVLAFLLRVTISVGTDKSSK